jgi:hypothetical protein
VTPTPDALDRPVANSVDDLTPDWLTAALGLVGVGTPVTAVSAERVGTGQIGTSYRLTLTYRDQSDQSEQSEVGTVGSRNSRSTGNRSDRTMALDRRQLVAKIAGGSVEARQRLSVGFEKEVGFSSTLAPTVDVRTPRCWYAALADDRLGFTLLLDDLAPARPGVQVDGCSATQAEDAVRNLAGLHAPRWNDASLRDLSFLTPTDEGGAAFLGEILAQATDTFVGRYADRLEATDVATLHEAAEAIAAWALARPRPFTVVHGDYRLDNLMFPPSGEGVAALDWQTVTVGPPLRDVAYLLGTSLDVAERRRHERTLVSAYHGEMVARGIDDYDRETCAADYRLGQLQGPMITVLGCVYAAVEPTPTSEAMFLAMATRSCAAIRDHDPFSLL